MKLKPIPQNTVVHTPTEAEARELIAILHENGYKWCEGSSLIEDSEWYVYEAATCYFISSYVEFDNIHKYNQDKIKPITLSKFKERYCEMTEPLTEKAEETSVIQQKPQPKFKVGDKVKVIEPNCWHSGQIGIVRKARTSYDQVMVTFGEM